MVIDCAVIGAGPAGLAASAALTASGVDHVVLERAEAGHTWRTQRWDSLRLNNPGWMNPMLGDQPAAAATRRRGPGRRPSATRATRRPGPA